MVKQKRIEFISKAWHTFAFACWTVSGPELQDSRLMLRSWVIRYRQQKKGEDNKK